MYAGGTVWIPLQQTHASQTQRFTLNFPALHTEQTINIPQLTFSANSPSPGFSYLINQLSFPLSEKDKREITFLFQRHG